MRYAPRAAQSLARAIAPLPVSTLDCHFGSAIAGETLLTGPNKVHGGGGGGGSAAEVTSLLLDPYQSFWTLLGTLLFWSRSPTPDPSPLVTFNPRLLNSTPELSTLNPNPKTSTPNLEFPNPKTQTQSPKPHTVKPKPLTPNPMSAQNTTGHVRSKYYGARAGPGVQAGSRCKY